MNKLNTIIAIAALTTGFAFAGTFQTIKLDQPTYSDTDPFGLTAISAVSQRVDKIETGLQSNIQNEVKNQLTNNTDVVIGQVTGTSADIGLVAKNKSIVMAVNRDMEEIEATEGSITFAADKIQLGALESIYVGNQTLQALLATAGGQNGDMNIIEEIQVNGVKVEPTNKVVKLTIPSIAGLAVATEVESTYAKKSEIPSLEGYAKTSDLPSTEGFVQKQYVDDELTNYVKLAELQEGIKFNTLEAKSFKIDGKDVAVQDDLANYIKKSDVSSAASTAITGINGATTIEEIQVALTNFLHTLVITPAP